MSTISFNITSAKISNDSFKKESKGDFEYGIFKIYPSLAKKDKGGNWESKLLQISCMITGYALQRFMKQFDLNYKNYITIINGRLTEFHIETQEKISMKTGKTYNDNLYKYFSIQVQDFDIRHEQLDEGSENLSRSEERSLPASQEQTDDDIPF